ncbi:MAG: DUF2007 domain-containing protein [Chloroflexi bacterium]|nr:DUF2007 domain-containing protein [Chloroflexota bacterium]MBT7081320.1 DUF2007 domain-containing protein [Chloroflexota bacterium]MBT7290488.1 DUF2007 domain-containing protein [Chloroflexota bacterium]
MTKSKSELVEICAVAGEIQASIIKSHLENEGIPVLLKYESMGRVLGVTVDGLGEVRVMVPSEFAEVAKQIIGPDV